MPMTEEELARRNSEIADVTHQQFNQQSQNSDRFAVDLGIEAIRTAALINGGSVVAGLAFISSLFTSDRYLAAQMLPAVFIFSCGVLFSGIASGCAYFSQMFFSFDFQSYSLDFTHPYCHPKPGIRWSKATGIAFQSLAVLFVMGSYGAVAAGAWLAWARLSPG